MYIELPAVEGTPESRIKALQAAKPLLSNTGGPFSGSGAAEAKELIEVATYIETGHSYADTHPVGKRRPKVVNVTVIAPHGSDENDIEHFVHHLVEDGLIENLIRSAREEAEKEPENTEGPVDPRDEPEHQPVDPKDRPRFGPVPEKPFDY